MVDVLFGKNIEEPNTRKKESELLIVCMIQANRGERRNQLAKLYYSLKKSGESLFMPGCIISHAHKGGGGGLPF